VVEEIGADAFVFCVGEVAGAETKLVARTEAKRAPERGARGAAPDRGRRTSSTPRAGRGS
jgi:hypothetical protein